MADDNRRVTRQQYHRQDEDPDENTTSGATRRAYAAENNRALEEVKTKRLGRKLNWVILGLVVAIAIVFLILFLTP